MICAIFQEGILGHLDQWCRCRVKGSLRNNSFLLTLKAPSNMCSSYFQILQLDCETNLSHDM